MEWISDIIFIRTTKGQFYLYVIIYLFARKVIAWNVSSSPSAKFVAEYGNTMHFETISTIDCWNSFPSISFSSGCPYDNAVVEAFFKFLKKKETNMRKFTQIEEVKQSVFSYIVIIIKGLMKLMADFHLMRKKRIFGQKRTKHFKLYW